MTTDEDDTQELRSFGRRRGRKRSRRQDALMRDLLPTVGVDLTAPPPAPLERAFAADVRETWLEVGFGGAEHLIWQARQHRDTGLIGCEPFEEGVVKALSEIEQGGDRNILVYSNDARLLLRWLPAASISRAFVLFPDPWPKARHRKRRLVAPPLLGMLARVMRTGAELRIGTDIGDYARTILMAFQGSADFRWTAEGPQDWRQRPTDWPATRYETKAIAAQRRPVFLRFERL